MRFAVGDLGLLHLKQRVWTLLTSKTQIRTSLVSDLRNQARLNQKFQVAGSADGNTSCSFLLRRILSSMAESSGPSELSLSPRLRSGSSLYLYAAAFFLVSVLSALLGVSYLICPSNVSPLVQNAYYAKLNMP